MSALPAAAAAANEQTLSDALAAASITAEPETTDDKAVEQPEKTEEDLEDGEIKEDDGTPKTVFHDSSRFNIKVGSLDSCAGWVELGRHSHASH